MFIEKNSCLLARKYIKELSVIKLYSDHSRIIGKYHVFASVETIMMICICQSYLVNIIFISISFDKTVQLLIINY